MLYADKLIRQREGDMNELSFGKTISKARKEKSINQRSLAERIIKEDGKPITPQYLNDIEHDRRVPSSDIVTKLAEILEIPAEYLEYLAGRIPEDWRNAQLSESQFMDMAAAFRKTK